MSFTQKGLLTAISYCRKSIKVKGLSVHESVHYQQSANQQYAELNRLEIVKEYSDVGYSGKDTNRPELQEMLNDLKSRAVVADVLIVYSVDRLKDRCLSPPDFCRKVGDCERMSKGVK
ncbi:MAG: recombinase family protein [Bacillus sp. (in: Bacteria)]|nr:recombinase family protein [Bacillus sp. (in: firmicutes)]